MKLDLSIYGVGVEILTSRLDMASVLENLGKDFEYFRVERPESEIKIRLELKAGAIDVHAEQPGPRLFKTKMCDVHGWGKKRFCNYGQGVWVRSMNEMSCRSFTIFGTETDLVYEAAYVALLSAAGEELDRLGFHRLHSVAIQANGANFALFADSGQGKSATAVLMSQESGTKIFSDEMPLIKDGILYPFPIRMALHPSIANSLGLNVSDARQFKRKIYPTKALFEIPRDLVAQPAPLRYFFFGICGSPGQFTHARPLRAREKLKFIFAFVMGLGLPQMAEHMLRTGNVFNLAKIALSRFKTALTLLGWGKISIQSQALILSKNPRENIQVILKALP
jgi:hypothetical protein